MDERKETFNLQQKPLTMATTLYPNPTPEELDSILAEELIALQTTHPEEIDEFSPQSVFGDEN